MAEPPRMESWLRRWEAANLIDAASVQAILDWEAHRPPDSPATPAAVAVSLTEALTYSAALVGLLGVGLVLFATGVGDLGRALALTLVAGAALAGTLAQRRAHAPQSERGAGATIALAVATAGAAVAEYLVAANVLTQTREFNTGFAGYSDVNRSGSVAVGALATFLLATVLVRRFRSQAGLGLVALVSAYVVSLTCLDAMVFAWQTNPGHPLVAAMFAVSAAAVLGFTAITTSVPDRNFLQAAVIAITAVAFYALGGSPDLELDGLGGLMSAAAIGLGARFALPGMAFAGAIGVAGLVVDIGARNFRSATAVGMFLVLAAGVGLGLILGVRRLLQLSSRAKNPTTR